MECYNEETWKKHFKEIKNMSSDELKEFIKSKKKISIYEWCGIFRSDNFTDDHIKEFSEIVPWDIMLGFRKIKEDLLEENFNKLDYYAVSTFQDISYSFIEKHKDVLSLDVLSKRVELSGHEKIKKLYEKLSDKKHQKIWRDNLDRSRLFATDVAELKKDKPTDLAEIDLTPEASTEKKTDYKKMSKAELKYILTQRKVRVYYHDTLDILIAKCEESEK